MAVWARYTDGVEVDERVFKVLAKYASSGTMDVFASDQHNSYLKLAGAYLKHIGQSRKANDDDVREVCRRFAAALEGLPSAALFNHLAFRSEGFRGLLGQKTMLIGRLEDTNTVAIDEGRGQLAQLAVDPESAVDEVDACKTLIKLDPDHKESWEKNREWLQDVFERCSKLGKPHFNETLIFQRDGESKADMGRRLPDAVVKMAEDFSPYGHFYKTQVPVLWQEGEDGVELVSSPRVIREATEAMAEVVHRPMLLLSAAVDFEQYAAQYGIVSDLVAGPMCGRAYFKECFTEPETTDLDSLAASFKRVALPRMKQIKGLAQIVSQPWWHRFEWMADKAKALLKPEEKPAERVKADFGY